MKSLMILIATLFIMAIGTVACDKLKTPLPEAQKSDSVADNLQAQEKQRSEFVATAQSELDELRAALAKLRSQAAAASQETKAKLQADIDRAEAELQSAQEKLAELKTASAQTWNKLQDAFSSALRTLKESIRSAGTTAG